MCHTHYTLSDLGYSLPARALVAFVRHAGPGFALWREIYDGPEEDVLWYEGGLDSQLLAQIADELASLTWTVAQTHTKKNLKSKMPKPIRRPGVDDGTRRIGRDPIPISEFDAWWYGESR